MCDAMAANDITQWHDFRHFQSKNMATTKTRKRGPKDGSYVNKKQEHEVIYEPKRKTHAKEFGASQKTGNSSKTK